MSFANPAGAWALAGLLAVLVIHLLQRRVPVRPVTTLFLVEPAALESLPGPRWDRLRRGLSLWLQLLSVLVLTWLLLDPRWLAAEWRVRTVLVLDSTASLSAFRERARAAVVRRLAAVPRERADWVVMETAPWRPPLYSGTDAAAAEGALARWSPDLPGHDFGAALEDARHRAGRGGQVLLVTDRAGAWPAGVEVLAVGTPTDNVGFVSGDAVVEAGRARYQALLRNHGRLAAARSLRVGEAAPVPLTLKPGELRTLSGDWPAGAERLTLSLDADAFTLDDTLPLVRPAPRPLRVRVAREAAALPFVSRFLAALDAVLLVESEADLTITRDTAVEGAALVLPPAESGGGPVREPAFATRHPLVRDLGWAGLAVRKPAAVPSQPQDEPLVVAGRRSLLLLRTREGAPQLVAGFTLEDSNAARLPAVLLALHRFAESVRLGARGREQANLQTAQVLALRGRVEPLDGSAAPAAAAGVLRAPTRPGFFHVRDGDEERLLAAAHFADAAEADLTAASSQDAPAPPLEAVARQAQQSPWTPLWVLLLGTLIVADGWLGERRA